jgi:hypothetical protein
MTNPKLLDYIVLTTNTSTNGLRIPPLQCLQASVKMILEYIITTSLKYDDDYNHNNNKVLFKGLSGLTARDGNHHSAN